jgi:hypothetical protein
MRAWATIGERRWKRRAGQQPNGDNSSRDYYLQEFAVRLNEHFITTRPFFL